MSMVQITPPPLSPQAMADLLCTIILLCRGTDADDKDFWAYLCIKPSMAQAFKDARDKGGYNLEDFGTIIEYGSGHDVPADIQVRMECDYGVNHRYEDELLAAIEMAKREEA